MKIQALQTIIHHASDIIFWLDATTGKSGTIADMQRIKAVLSVELSSRPRDLKLLYKPGRMVMWRDSDSSEVNGLPTEAERTRPTPDTYALTGTVFDDEGNYNPRTFNLSVGLGDGHTVTLYPTPKNTRIGMGGGLVGNIRFFDTELPAAWALLSLEVEIAPHTDLTFVAQADSNGDFSLAMSRLPPLPENVDDYEAKLTIHATTTADGNVPMDPSGQDEMEIAVLDEADEYEDELQIHVVPGEILNLKSFNKEFLAVRPTE